MPNYRAVANGNWGTLATWQDDSLGYFTSSVALPTTSDDVYSNNFTIGIDTSIVASSLRSTAFSPPTTLGAVPIPLMTSNTTPSGTAAASTTETNFGLLPAYTVFDRNNSTVWGSSIVNTAWLSYQFTSAKIIKRYGFLSFSSNNNNPRTWTFEGSNDGSSWTILDTQTNFTTLTNTFYSFDISSNVTSYLYYRINITAVQTVGNAVRIPTLEMGEVTNLYGNIVAGGSFNFNSGSISGSITSATPLVPGATNLIQVTATSGTVGLTLEGNVTPRAATNDILINHSGNCNFTVSGTNFNGVSSVNGVVTISKSSPGTTTVIGNINGPTGGTGAPNATISSGAGFLVVTGNVTSGFVSNTINVGSTAQSLTVNGNIIGGAVTIITTASPVNFINGTVTGGTVAPITSTSANQINVSGSVIASANANAITSTNASGIVTLNGNMFNNTGKQAIYCQNLFLNDTGTTQAQFFTSGSQDRTLYSANTFPNLPSGSNVRSTTSYGPNNELLGSLIIPDPANVRYGVLTDNTTGSALLSAENLFSEISSSNNPVAVRLRQASTTNTVGNLLTAFKK